MLTRDIAGSRWYVETVAYPTAAMAKRAWERAERKLIRRPGEEGIGVTRLAPRPEGGLPTGAADRHAVAVVTRDEPTIRRAQRLLGDGEPFEPMAGLADALIARRARVVLGHAGQGDGRVIVRRPESRGAEFNQRGEVSEPPPGRG